MQKLLSVFHSCRKFTSLIFGFIIFVTVFFSGSIFAATSSDSSKINITVAPVETTSPLSHLATKPIVVTNHENHKVFIAGLLVTGYDRSKVKYCNSDGGNGCTYVSTCQKWPYVTELNSNQPCYIYLQAKTTDKLVASNTTKKPVYITFYAGKDKDNANKLISAKLNVSYENALYVGGRFTAAGDPNNKANNIAKWDGTNWSTLANGLNRDVMALALYRGDLYAGGVFDYAMTNWNGANWKIFANGLGNFVRALAVNGDNLYIGGVFSKTVMIDGKSTLLNNIAMWDGSKSKWSSLGGGTNDRVLALAISGNNLYAGGYFQTAGGVAASNVAMWDGLKWNNLGHGTDGDVNTIAVNDDTVYAGGTFNSAGNAIAHGLAQWDSHDNSWSAVPRVDSSYTYGLAVNNQDLYVAGDYSISGWARAEDIGIWNSISKSWRHMGVADSFTWALAVSDNDLYVGGAFPSINDGAIPASKIAKWDMANSSWSTLGKGVFGDIVFAVAVAPAIKITE